MYISINDIYIYIYIFLNFKGSFEKNFTKDPLKKTKHYNENDI